MPRLNVVESMLHVASIVAFPFVFSFRAGTMDYFWALTFCMGQKKLQKNYTYIKDKDIKFVNFQLQFA